LKQYTPHAQITHTLHTQPGVTYAQITKQNSYAATNIEQDQHKPTSSANQRHTRLKNMMKIVFLQMGTMLNLLTTLIT
jgi:hypothetical protein